MPGTSSIHRYIYISLCWIIALSSRRFYFASALSQTQTVSEIASTMVVDMGQDKLVNIFTPSWNENLEPEPSKSSIALARMMAHCPTLVEGKNVLELQCGLGLVSASACKHARPEHVAVTDNDSDNLSLAYASCTRLQRSRASVSRCRMDWNDPETWPKQKYDLLVASDALTTKASIVPLTKVLQHYLGSSSGSSNFRKRALIVDPLDQMQRDEFCLTAFRAGLDVEVSSFPGMKDFVLLDVFSRCS